MKKETVIATVAKELDFPALYHDQKAGIMKDNICVGYDNMRLCFWHGQLASLTPNGLCANTDTRTGRHQPLELL